MHIPPFAGSWYFGDAKDPDWTNRHWGILRPACSTCCKPSSVSETVDLAHTRNSRSLGSFCALARCIAPFADPDCERFGGEHEHTSNVGFGGKHERTPDSENFGFEGTEHVCIANSTTNSKDFANSEDIGFEHAAWPFAELPASWLSFTFAGDFAALVI